MKAASPTRKAHPYDDTDVIDARAPRFNQAVVGTVSLLALLTGAWWLAALLALQLAVGLAFGRRWCLPCVAYFELVQPRLGEGKIEDARPPRFANLVGACFLTAAALAHLAGAEALGRVLTGIVAALALFAAFTGICVGCEIYRLGARLRGIRPGHFTSVDLSELGVAPAGRTVVEFTHPLCTDCRRLEERLRAAGESVVVVDVSRRPDLARRYGVAVVPTAVAVDGSGQVTERIA